MKQGRFPCGRMSSVQSGLEPWATPTCGLQWCLQVPDLILGYSTILDAPISGLSWWLSSLDLLAFNSGHMDNYKKLDFSDS